MSDKVVELTPAEPRSDIIPTGKIMLPSGEYTLRVDFNALAEIEEATGRNMMDPGAFQNLSIKAIRAICWICIRQEHPTVTETGVGKDLSLANLGYVLQTIVSVWTKAMPKKREETKVPLQ